MIFCSGHTGFFLRTHVLFFWATLMNCRSVYYISHMYDNFQPPNHASQPILETHFGGHMSYFGATATAVWISGDISSGFQSQSGFCFICLFCRGECNVHSLRSTSSATCADLLTASIAASNFPRCISRGRTWLRFELTITWTEEECATIVPATWLRLH